MWPANTSVRLSRLWKGTSVLTDGVCVVGKLSSLSLLTLPPCTLPRTRLIFISNDSAFSLVAGVDQAGWEPVVASIYNWDNSWDCHYCCLHDYSWAQATNHELSMWKPWICNSSHLNIVRLLLHSSTVQYSDTRFQYVAPCLNECLKALDWNDLQDQSHICKCMCSI